jgi:DNA-binding transcriptional ArsR family regulator
LVLFAGVVDVPARALVSREMAALLNVLAHPHRVRIVQELRESELDVNGLQALLDISHSRVSQHLSILRSNRIVVERRDGRHVFYRLVQPELAAWLRDGFRFLTSGSRHTEEIKEAVERSRELWRPQEPARQR